MGKFQLDASQLVLNVDIETVKDFLLKHLSKPQNMREAVEFVLEVDANSWSYDFCMELFPKLIKQFFHDAESDGEVFEDPVLKELQNIYNLYKEDLLTL